MKYLKISILMVVVSFLLILSSSSSIAEEQKDELLQLNEIAPEFNVQDFKGNSVDLAQKLKSGPIVLVFLRGFACPYSRKHLDQMQNEIEKFKVLGAEIVVVVRDDAKRVNEYWQENRLGFTGIADKDSRLGDLYKQQWKFFKLGLMPAMFVIDSDRKIHFVHYSSSMKDIPENKTLFEVLGKIKKDNKKTHKSK